MRNKQFKRVPSTEVECWFDGACWPNPNGHASCGALVKRHGVTVHRESKYLGCNSGTSNNVAEYSGAILILEYLLANGINHATIYGDSNMVVHQMNRKWKAKEGKLYIPYFRRARDLKDQLSHVRFVWIPREENAEADALSKTPLYQRNIEERYSPRRAPKDFYPHVISKVRRIRLVRNGLIIN